MPINDPAAIKFANERVRPLADRLARMAFALQIFLAEYQAKGLEAQFPDDATVVEDGSGADGRTPITGHDVREMVRVAQDLATMATGDTSRMPTIMKVAVNPQD
jgi:hypothetical protein